MKKYVFYIIAATGIALGFVSFRPEEKKDVEMKQYYFAMLTKGKNRDQDSITAAKIQQGHMANITQLTENGKLCIAGPFGDDGNWRGILILDAKTLEEAKTLVEKDPAVQAGRLQYEIHPWWGGIGSKLK